jgi:hypothetical protein
MLVVLPVRLALLGRRFSFFATLLGIGAAGLVAGCGDDVGGDPAPGPDASIDTGRPDAVEAGDARVDRVDAGAPQDASADSLDLGTEFADATVPLLAKSPECLACAQRNCPAYVNGCSMITGRATRGPAAGTSKADLCVETLSCILPTGCAAHPETCYCSKPSSMPLECPLRGPCTSTFERSMETTQFSTLVASASDTSKGGAWAMLLMQCLSDHLCTSCLTVASDAGDGGDAADAPAEAGRPDGSTGIDAARRDATPDAPDAAPESGSPDDASGDAEDGDDASDGRGDAFVDGADAWVDHRADADDRSADGAGSGDTRTDKAVLQSGPLERANGASATE